MNDKAKKIFQELTDVENMLILKYTLAGEDPSVEEMIQLHELRLLAYQYGYIIPKDLTLH